MPSYQSSHEGTLLHQMFVLHLYNPLPHFIRYTLDDGSVVEVSFIADENGYRAESPIIPAQPPHVAELLRIAEQQRAEGVQFDEQGRRI